MKKIALLAFALFIVPCAARASEHTVIKLVNDTGHWIRVYSRVNGIGSESHVFVVKPMDLVTIRETEPFGKFSTSVSVAVLRNRTDVQHICTTLKTFHNTTGGSPIRQDVHYSNGTCSIDSP